MNWRINNGCKVETTQVDGTQLWEIELQATAIRDVAIGLCLVWNGLVSILDLVDSTHRRMLRIQLAEDPRNNPATVTWEAESAVVTFSHSELEAWMFFLLRTVRDGVAEVDHLDLEANAAISGQQSGSFVLKFPSSAPAVSPEEARRRLGL
jgi:hypothetical protein